MQEILSGFQQHQAQQNQFGQQQSSYTQNYGPPSQQMTQAGAYGQNTGYVADGSNKRRAGDRDDGYDKRQKGKGGQGYVSSLAYI